METTETVDTAKENILVIVNTRRIDLVCWINAIVLFALSLLLGRRLPGSERST